MLIYTAAPDSMPHYSVRRGHIAFNHPTLHGYSAPVFDIVGRHGGPRLCVMAGLHVDEVSSIVAATQIEDRIRVEDLRGTISVVPIVNTPGKFSHTDKFPQDGRNLHWQFPGRPDGTFTEVLAHAMLHHWVGDAIALLDLHGGDIGEAQRPFVLFQRTGEPHLDVQAEALARCFDTQFVVGLEPELIGKPGRCCSALAGVGRCALVCERGDNGVLSRDAADWHIDGVLRVAHHLGMLPVAPPLSVGRATVLPGYRFLTAPCDGQVRFISSAGALVKAGEMLAELHDDLRHRIGEVRAPVEGYVLWYHSMLFAREGSWVGALGVVR